MGGVGGSTAAGAEEDTSKSAERSSPGDTEVVPYRKFKMDVLTGSSASSSSSSFSFSSNGLR